MTAVFRIVLTLGVIFGATLFADGPRVLLGPRDPIASDGSLKAGRALTISEMDLSEVPAAPDLDDPSKFVKWFSNSSIERDRDVILAFVGSFGPALCERQSREKLVAVIQDYYSTKQYLNNEFHFRGPRAGQFIDAAWTTPKDRQIDDFVKQLLKAGYLRTREVWPRSRSFLLDVFDQGKSPRACS